MIDKLLAETEVEATEKAWRVEQTVKTFAKKEDLEEDVDSNTTP